MTQLQGFKPYPKQKVVIDSIISSEEMFHTMVTGRQSGKSTTLLGLVLYYSINKPKSTCLWVSPVYSQINKVLTQIVDTLQPSGIIVSANKANYEIKLINGSIIYFRSAERADTIRGLSIDYLFVDESQDLKTSDWQKSILPTITARGKKVVLGGTPKKKGFFYDYYQMGKSPDFPNHASYNFPSWESPYVSKDFIEEQRKTLPDNIFKQEFEAVFLDDDGHVFKGLNNVLINDAWPQRSNGTNVYGGLDLGTREDWSVLTLIDELGRVIYIWRDRHLPYSDIVSKVVQLCKQYNVRELLVESNGAGDVMFEQIKKQYSRAEPLFQTNDTKSNIIRRLMGDIEDINIELPSLKLFPFLGDEMEIFEYEVLPSGKIRYSHPNGFHDDTVISLAMANWSRVNPRRGGGIKISSLR